MERKMTCRKRTWQTLGTAPLGSATGNPTGNRTDRQILASEGSESSSKTYAIWPYSLEIPISTQHYFLTKELAFAWCPDRQTDTCSLSPTVLRGNKLMPVERKSLFPCFLSERKHNEWHDCCHSCILGSLTDLTPSLI